MPSYFHIFFNMTDLDIVAILQARGLFNYIEVFRGMFFDHF